MSDKHTSNSLIDSYSNVGILGGTFDPPHEGHLMLADSACHAFALDKVIFVVASQPWQKVEKAYLSAFEDRFTMTELAVEERFGSSKKFLVSDVEARIGGDSYTSKTISYLRSLYPSNNWFPIIGADVAASLNTWRDTKKLQELVTFIIANRPGDNGNLTQVSVPPGWKYRTLAMKNMAISSSSVRKRIANNQSVADFLPASVAQYIETHQLYL